MRFPAPTRRLLQLFEALDQAAIVTDPAGKIVSWSGSAERIYGWRREEVLGRDILEVTPTALSREMGRGILTALRSGVAWSGTFEVQRRDGSKFLASVTDVPLLGKERELIGIVGISAEASESARLGPLIAALVERCEAVWPGRIRAEIAGGSAERVAVSEPHLVQLLALLLVREATRGRLPLEVHVEPADAERLHALGSRRNFSAAAVRIVRRGARSGYSLLRPPRRRSESSDYAADLVRIAGGLLVEGALPNQPPAIHLVLPVR